MRRLESISRLSVVSARGIVRAHGLRRYSLGIAASLLLACTPEYNWREIKNLGDGYQVMLPAKPITATREINLDGAKVTMTVSAAQVNDTLFSVGTVTLPADSSAQRAGALAAMRAQMVRNLNARETKASHRDIALLNFSGAPLSRVASTQIEANGSTQPKQIMGGFTAHGNKAYQFLVIGDKLDLESSRYFIDSFRLIQQ